MSNARDPDYIGPYDPDTDGPPGDDHDCTGEGEEKADDG